MNLEINTIRGIKKLKLRGKYSNVTVIEQRVRKALINYVVNNKIPFNINLDSFELLDIDNISEVSFKETIENLLLKRVFTMDEEGDINFIYPVSAISTNHKVRLADGRIFSAMCAIDAMGTAFTFNQDVDIESKCSHCGEDIKVSIRNGKLNIYKPSDLHILHVDLNKNTDWSGEC